MSRKKFPRVPRHVGFIPDGNRRWAEQRGLPRAAGYAAGVEPGWCLMGECRTLGIEEITIYGFTQDNTRRPRKETEAYRAACWDFAKGAIERGAALLAVGDTSSPLFPDELRPYTEARAKDGTIRVNLLVNYGWQWDLQTALAAAAQHPGQRLGVMSGLASAAISRIDLIVRWGGRCRLSGFPPIQSVYADLHVVPELWPDYRPQQFHAALQWYATQDITLGG